MTELEVKEIFEKRHTRKIKVERSLSWAREPSDSNWSDTSEWKTGGLGRKKFQTREVLSKTCQADWEPRTKVACESDHTGQKYLPSGIPARSILGQEQSGERRLNLAWSCKIIDPQWGCCQLIALLEISWLEWHISKGYTQWLCVITFSVTNIYWLPALYKN